MLCFLLAGCYRPDQQKLEREARALVQPGMTMAAAQDHLFSHGFTCVPSHRVGNKRAADCKRSRGLGCMEALSLEPEEGSAVVTALSNLRAVCAWL